MREGAGVKSYSLMGQVGMVPMLTYMSEQQPLHQHELQPQNLKPQRLRPPPVRPAVCATTV